MKIAITGHRPNKLGDDYNLTSPLIKKIEDRILEIWNDLEAEYLSENPLESCMGVEFITGMALGVDTLFAKIAIQNNVPFIAALPCSGQYRKWPEKSKKIYHEIVNNPLCTKHYVSSLPYTNRCMQERNVWMVNNCDVLIAVWDTSAGGTANCVKYAEGKKRIIHINPKEL